MASKQTLLLFPFHLWNEISDLKSWMDVNEWQCWVVCLKLSYVTFCLLIFPYLFCFYSSKVYPCLKSHYEYTFIQRTLNWHLVSMDTAGCLWSFAHIASTNCDLKNTNENLQVEMKFEKKIWIFQKSILTRQMSFLKVSIFIFHGSCCFIALWI